jgi:hypothetical protein
MPAMPYGQVPMQHEDCPGCKWLYNERMKQALWTSLSFVHKGIGSFPHVALKSLLSESSLCALGRAAAVLE